MGNVIPFPSNKPELKCWLSSLEELYNDYGKKDGRFIKGSMLTKSFFKQKAISNPISFFEDVCDSMLPFFATNMLTINAGRIAAQNHQHDLMSVWKDNPFSKFTFESENFSTALYFIIGMFQVSETDFCQWKNAEDVKPKLLKAIKFIEENS